MLPDPRMPLVLAEPMEVPSLPSALEFGHAWVEALSSVGLQLWADRGFVLIGGGLALLLAVGLSAWGRRGADS